MQLDVRDQGVVAVERLGFEVVERKGIGHPDSMADLLAEEFSQRYSRLGLDRFGIVPNHWVDKVALIGAAAAVDFGRFQIDKPVTAYLFGKVTGAVGGEPIPIPIPELFQSASAEVLSAATQRPDIVAHLRTVVENTAGTTTDHPSAFYRPATAEECRRTQADRRANDTAFCSAYAPASGIEHLAIEVENFVNDEPFANCFPMIGSDVKVLILRADSDLYVTICLPFHPELVPSLREYESCLSAARRCIGGFIEEHLSVRPRGGCLHLALNTKDIAGGAYLAPFGTSLGKGDCGLVGRGNKSNGVISAVRCAGVEAVAGKNPIHHAGKLYTLAASRIANGIHAQLGLQNETVLVSRNGDRLDDPAFVGVRLTDTATRAQRDGVRSIVADVMSTVDLLSKWLLDVPPMQRFRDPAVMSEG